MKGNKDELIKDIQKLTALATSESKQEAYLKLHPDCTPLSARTNATKYFKDVINIQDLSEIIAKFPSAKPITENILRCYWYIFSESMNSKIKKYDVAVAVLKEISKLCPDFSEKHQFNILSKMTPDELDLETKTLMAELGILESKVIKGEVRELPEVKGTDSDGVQ